MSDQQQSGARPHVVRHSKGKRPEFYEQPGLDQAMSMILVLANEVAVLNDRIDSMSRVHKSKGLDMPAEVEALILDQDALESREAWRQNFLERLYYLMRKDAAEAAEAQTTAAYMATIDEIATT